MKIIAILVFWISMLNYIANVQSQSSLPFATNIDKETLNMSGIHHHNTVKSYSFIENWLNAPIEYNCYEFVEANIVSPSNLSTITYFPLEAIEKLYSFQFVRSIKEDKNHSDLRTKPYTKYTIQFKVSIT